MEIGVPEENIENITKSDSNFAPTFADHHILPDINFNGHSLINNIYIPKIVTNKNAYPGKYKYSSSSIGYSSRLEFSFTNRSMEENDIIFGTDMSSSVDVDNKGKCTLTFDEGPTQGLDNTTLTLEAMYPINFTQSNKRFVLDLHHNGNNSLLMLKKYINSKQRTLK